jgi:hypothetical protein
MHPAVPLRLKKAQKQLAYLVSRAILHDNFSVIAHILGCPTDIGAGTTG